MNATPNRVLIIAYAFPPCNVSGTYRPLRFVKYLPERWKAVVLTVKPEAYSPTFSTDSALLNQLPDDLTVIQTPVFDGFQRLLAWQKKLKSRWQQQSNNRAEINSTAISTTRKSRLQQLKDNITDFFMTPDAQIGWLPYAVRAGKKAIRKHQVKVIYSTGSPWTDHLIGHRLKRSSGLPWIADFRDPWTQSLWHTWKSPLRLRREGRMEAEVVREADVVIANTEPLRLDFIRRYPAEPEAKFITITNGYDPDNLASLNIKMPINQVMTMTHTGGLYAKRSPRNLLLAIQMLLHEGMIPAHGIQLRFVGQTRTDDIEDILGDKRIKNFVEMIPKVPHHQSLQYLIESDVLLIIQPKAPMQIPGKLFEYMYVQRPILAITESEGATANIIRQAQLGTIVEPEDILGLKKAIYDLYERFQCGTLLPSHNTTNVLRQYDARVLTQQFVNALDRLVNNQAE